MPKTSNLTRFSKASTGTIWNTVSEALFLPCCTCEVTAWIHAISLNETLVLLVMKTAGFFWGSEFKHLHDYTSDPPVKDFVCNKGAYC